MVLATLTTLFSRRETVPSLDEVPVGEVLLQVIGVSAAGPVDKVEVDIVEAKVLEGGVNALGDTVVPGVVKLGGNPDLLARDTRVPDTLSNLGFVAIGKGTNDGFVRLSSSRLSGKWWLLPTYVSM